MSGVGVCGGVPSPSTTPIQAAGTRLSLGFVPEGENPAPRPGDPDFVACSAKRARTGSFLGRFWKWLLPASGPLRFPNKEAGAAMSLCHLSIRVKLVRTQATGYPCAPPEAAS